MGWNDKGHKETFEWVVRGKAMVSCENAGKQLYDLRFYLLFGRLPECSEHNGSIATLIPL